jgi:hypothetical protein
LWDVELMVSDAVWMGAQVWLRLESQAGGGAGVAGTVCSILLLVALVCWPVMGQVRRGFVERTSARVAQLWRINQEFAGDAARNLAVRLHHDASSLRQFRSIQAETIANGRSAEWEPLVALVRRGRWAATEYNRRFAELEGTPNQVTEYPWFIREKGYARVERHVLSKLHLKFNTDCAVFVSWQYVSPQGRNRYEANKTLTFEDLEALLVQLDKQQRYRMSAQYERSLMTPSMRADILRRDGYRCIKCGATAQQGAELHIDHIRPVSMGGATTPENLQTLCAPCNTGKGNRFIG